MGGKRALLDNDRLIEILLRHRRCLGPLWDAPGAKLEIEAHVELLADWRTIRGDGGRFAVETQPTGGYCWMGCRVRPHRNFRADAMQLVHRLEGATTVLPLVSEEEWSWTEVGNVRTEFPIAG